MSDRSVQWDLNANKDETDEMWFTIPSRVSENFELDATATTAFRSSNIDVVGRTAYINLIFQV